MPDAKQGAVIGNGSGMSSHLLLGSPALEKLVTIDIEPEMINGSHTFYPVNRRVFDDPRSQYVHDDAKSYFAASNRKFDLILSEPSNPWVSGVSGLFTDEFYQRIHTYLTPHGVFGQWLHLYEIDDGLVLGVIKAIHRNFASYEIFLTAASDILIVASNDAALPKPDWRVFQLPKITSGSRALPADHAARRSRGLRLLSREVLAPLAGDPPRGELRFLSHARPARRAHAVHEGEREGILRDEQRPLRRGGGAARAPHPAVTGDELLARHRAREQPRARRAAPLRETARPRRGRRRSTRTSARPPSGRRRCAT